MGIITSDIKKEFGTPPTKVLKGISITIESGEFVSIVGRSGCGKSTLLYIISSLDEPSSGSVVIDDHNLQSLTPKELHQFRNQNMGFIFQFHHLLPELNALENVLMPAIKANRLEERRNHAISLLKEFGLENKLDRFPGQLSGGEQQRVAIARALIMEPKYLFADEPTGNLDSANGIAVMNLLKKFNREQGMAIIMVTHDMGFADMATRKIKMSDGMIE